MHRREKSPQAMNLKALVVALAMGGLCQAHAFSVDLGDSDTHQRWDNTVRLNGAWRVDGRDAAIANNPVSDEGDYKFGRGDMVSQRLDLLSEVDLDWKRTYGARISATAWYDHAYHDTTVRGNPAFGGLTSYTDDKYSGFTKRYHAGPSAELLDAFVFANVEPAEVPVSVKAGRFSTFWGNSLFFAGGIARGQQPIDGRKALTAPGSEVKELFLPLTQVSLAVQPSSALSLTAQYYLDWDTTRAPEGGTYLAAADLALEGPDQTGIPGFNIPRAAALGPAKKRGNWGINAKFTPEAFAGQSVGVYYRKYDEKTPWLFTVPGVPAYRTVFARDAELFGLGFDGRIDSFSVGAELGYHKNVGLSSVSFAPVTDGARGNTWHALINGVYILTPTPLWETGTLLAELTYTKLDKITKNAALFNGVGAACTVSATGQPGTVKDGCATDDAWGVGLKLSPDYPQVLPGVDMTVNLSYNLGVKGNSASALGTSEGVATYSVGLAAKINVVHSVELLWADQTAPMRVLGGVAVSGNGSYQLNDRGRVSLTYKTSF